MKRSTTSQSEPYVVNQTAESSTFTRNPSSVATTPDTALADDPYRHEKYRRLTELGWTVIHDPLWCTERCAC